MDNNRMDNRERYLTVSEDHAELLDLRGLFAKLVRLLGEEEDRRKLERIDAELTRLKAEAVRLEALYTGTGDAAAREADRYFEMRAHTSRIEGEFLDMISGVMISPVTPEAERQICQALTTIEAKYGAAAAEHCRRLVPGAPVDFDPLREEVKT